MMVLRRKIHRAMLCLAAAENRHWSCCVHAHHLDIGGQRSSIVAEQLRPCVVTAMHHTRPQRRRSAAVPVRERTLLGSRRIPKVRVVSTHSISDNLARYKAVAILFSDLRSLMRDRLDPESLHVAQPNQFPLVVGQFLDALIKQPHPLGKLAAVGL